MAIERGDNLYDFLKRFNKQIDAESITRRFIYSFETKDTIKECMQTITPDGSGKDRPIIPGSSIKGAIRTALLATSPQAQDSTSKLNRISSSDIEKSVFNEQDMKDSYLKSLRVGDAIFDPEATFAYLASSLNYRYGNNKIYDKKLDALIESIPEESESNFTISMDANVLQAINCSSIQQLFKRLNTHILKLLSSELDICNHEFVDVADSSLDDYLEHIKELKEHVQLLIDQDSTQCLLRIGYGSGWRFMTGAWTESREDFYDVIVPKSRFKAENYSDYVFPKTRRLSLGDGPFGFVKLSIQ